MSTHQKHIAAVTNYNLHCWCVVTCNIATLYFSNDVKQSNRNTPVYSTITQTPIDVRAATNYN